MLPGELAIILKCSVTVIGSIDLDLVCTHFPDPKRLKVVLFRRLSERESELVVAEEVPLPGLKGPSDFEAGSSPLNTCWGALFVVHFAPWCT